MILLIVVLIAFLALWAVIEFWTRWYLTRMVAREAEEVAKAAPTPGPESAGAQVRDEGVAGKPSDGDGERAGGAPTEGG